MLPVSHRLRKEWEVNRVFKKGKTLSSPSFIIKYFPSKRPSSRACVIVTKKYDKRAVKRNTLKRKFCEAIHHSIINLQKSFDIAILPHPRSESQNFQDLQKILIEKIESL